MRLIVVFLFTLLLTCQTWAEPRIVNLGDLLEDRERVFLGNAFPAVDVDAVLLVEIGWDGPGGICAFVEIIEETPSLIIWLDSDDWAGTPLVRGVFQADLSFTLTVLHELIHIDQTLRGIDFRRQMAAACESHGYRDRFFEREAYAVSWILLGKWPVLR